jgi:hypothetical protein
MNAMIIFILMIALVIFFIFLAIESYKTSDLGDEKDADNKCQNKYSHYIFYISIILGIISIIATIAFAYMKSGTFIDTINGIKNVASGDESSRSGTSRSGTSTTKSGGGDVKWNEWKLKNGASSLKVTADRIEGSKDAWIKLPGGNELKINSGLPFKKGGPTEWDVTVPGDTNEGFITLTIGDPGPYQYKEMLQVDGQGKLLHTNPIRSSKPPSMLSGGLGYSRTNRGPSVLQGSEKSNPINSNALGVTQKGYENQQRQPQQQRQQQQQQQQKKNLDKQSLDRRYQADNYGGDRRYQADNYGGGGLQADLGRGGGGYNKDNYSGGSSLFSPYYGAPSSSEPQKTGILKARGQIPDVGLGKKVKIEPHIDGFFHYRDPSSGQDMIGPRVPDL